MTVTSRASASIEVVDGDGDNLTLRDYTSGIVTLLATNRHGTTAVRIDLLKDDIREIVAFLAPFAGVQLGEPIETPVDPNVAAVLERLNVARELAGVLYTDRTYRTLLDWLATGETA